MKAFEIKIETPKDPFKDRIVKNVHAEDFAKANEIVKTKYAADYKKITSFVEIPYIETIV